MKKIYIARRIPKQPKPEFILPLKENMTPAEIHITYIEKTQTFEKYIYNGPWILRPPVSEDVFSLNKMPKELTPLHICNMVKEKIESSDIFLGIINSKSYGTIAEAGYACKCSNIAVYILPDINVTSEELQDLWFMFQIAKNTKHLWCDEDIKTLDEFSKLGINSIKQYELYLSDIIPNFMKN